jgi:hypothetical protein
VDWLKRTIRETIEQAQQVSPTARPQVATHAH